MKSENGIPRRGFIERSLFGMGLLSTDLGWSFGQIEQVSSIFREGAQKEPADKKIKTVAFLANTYWNQSHADVIGTKMFLGIPMDHGLLPTNVKIVSVWIDQIGANDTGVRIAKMNGATVYSTIADALTLGGDKLAVDAVVYIGEHGVYPSNRFGEKLYPHLNFLEQIFRVFDASNVSVPVYSDKHLAYSWLDSKWIYDRALELNVPMMAGSSLPYAWRNPNLEHPIGTKITEAIAITYSNLNIYGIHVIELLQCMVERRAGGETGIASVHTIEGAEVWKALDSGEISWDLVNAAYDKISYKLPGKLRDLVKEPVAVKLQYNDGMKGAIFIFNGFKGKRPDGLRNNGGWGYAANANDKIVSTEFVLDPSISHSHFSYLVYNVEKFILSGQTQAPIERNLLSSGVSDMAIRSLYDGELKQTPFLNMKYSAMGYDPFRSPNAGPTGPSVGPWPPKGYEFINWDH